MVFVLAVGLWFFLLFLSTLWWRRLRGLCEFPDERDWQWEKIHLAVLGRALLNNSFNPLSASGHSCALCCCWRPCPCAEPLPTHAYTGDSPKLAGGFASVSCGVTAPSLWVLVYVIFCLCSPRLESLLPLVLWKSYNQILLAFKVRLPEGPQSLC